MNSIVDPFTQTVYHIYTIVYIDKSNANGNKVYQFQDI